MGNIKSLTNALEFLGARYSITRDAQAILEAKKIILPGVGAFNQAMDNLRHFHLVEVLERAVFEKHIPILGICLGMQILAEIGEENGPSKGLGWIKGIVKRFHFSNQKLSIPHIGFNSVYFEEKKSNLFKGLQNGADFYFIHSYHLVGEDDSDVVAFTDYGGKFISAVQKDNIFGVQFHPEKSQSNGLTLLKNFLLF